jgi:hypothetical protein
MVGRRCGPGSGSRPMRALMLVMLNFRVLLPQCFVFYHFNSCHRLGEITNIEKQARLVA